MSDTYVIDQPAGLGDIFFVQKIAAHYRELGHRVLHPVTQLMWNSGAHQVVSQAEFGPIGTLDIPSGAIRLDLSNQPRRTEYDVMQSKYEGLGLDWRDWADFFVFDRRPEQERHLAESFGLRHGDPFILLNDNYSLGDWAKKMDGPNRCVPDGYDGKVISMFLTQSVFDWCWLLENAEEIHSVDTCVQYIMDKLELRARRITTHPRHYARTKLAVGDLFSTPMEWVEYERDEWRELAPEEAE